MSEANAFQGQMDLSSETSEFNMTSFIIDSILGLVRTATLVKVVAVHPNGVAASPGTVDVQPMVNMLDGQGKSYEHGTVYGLPYGRIQGGTWAIILDPQVGDIGIAIFADRDISSVKSTKAVSNPGSYRSFNFADGMYIGGFLNSTPNQYILLSTNGVKILDKNNNTVDMTSTGIKLTDLSGNIVNMTASGIAITGNVSITGTLMNNGVNVGSTHVHAGVQTGGSNTAIPH